MVDIGATELAGIRETFRDMEFGRIKNTRHVMIMKYDEAKSSPTLERILFSTLLLIGSGIDEFFNLMKSAYHSQKQPARGYLSGANLRNAGVINGIIGVIILASI